MRYFVTGIPKPIVILLIAVLLARPSLFIAKVYANAGFIAYSHATLGKGVDFKAEGLSQSAEWLTQSLFYDGDNAEAYRGLGLVRFNQARYAEAVQLFSKAKDINSTYIVEFELGNVYEAMGLREKALDEWQAAGAFDTLRNALMGQGLDYLEQHQPQKALIEFQRFCTVAEISRNGYWISESYRLLGLAYRDNGQGDLAEASFKTAIRLGGENFPAQAAMAELGRMYVAMPGRAEEGIALLCSAIRLDPRRDYYRLLLGEAYTRNAHGDLASVVLADYYLTVGDPSKAVETLEAGMSAYPESASIHYLLGDAYAMLGQQKLAEKQYSAARNFTSERPQFCP